MKVGGTAFYGADLARIHEEGFADRIADAVPALLALLREAECQGGTVLDLGCGDGGWLRAAADAGYEVAGVEVSEAFATRARARVPEARIIQGSLHEVALPACDVITALGEVLSYVAPTGADVPLSATVARLGAALRPGGLLLFDALVREGGPPASYRSWREAADWTVLVDVHEDGETGLLTREIVTFVRDGEVWQRGHERHHQLVRPEDEIRRALEEQGFRVSVHAGWGDRPLPRGRRAFVARSAPD